MMSDLAMVTDIPVSVVTRHGLSYIKPLVISLQLLLLLVSTLSETRG